MAEGYAVATDVGWVVAEDAAWVALAALPDGPPVALRDSSALIWLAALDGGGPDDVIGRVAEQTGEAVATVRDDVVAFLDELVRLGLLRRGDQSSSSPSR